QLYQEGRTVGTFQFESVGMQKYLKELHPTVFEDLIAMNALYRPGPMDKIPSFIARKNGREEIAYEIPCMEKYLKDTYGITVYQEQVMLLSRQLANFTRGESDALRKAMGKKKKDIVDKMKPKFIEGGVKNGHDPKVLEDIWSAWEKFASYAFNKSHAACYSWVAYQTAYLKAHYPQEFMAALLTQRKDDIKEVTKLLDECRAMNIEVLGPDVNESHTDFGVNSKKQIRFGLMAIKGLGASAAEAIVNERKDHGPYKNIFDFVQRVPISAIKRNGLECLALSGAFDTFSDEIQREQFMAISNKGELFIDTLTRYSNQFQQAQQNAQFSLFGMDAIEVNTPQIPQAEKWSTLERLNREKELVGIYLSAHPLDEYSVVLKGMCNLHMDTMADLTPFVDQNVTLGGIVTDVRNGISNKSNKPYGIVTMEDYSGSGEIRLFAEEWVKWANYMSPGNTLYMTGRIHLPWTTSTKPSLKIESIDFLSNVKDRLINSITINVVLPELDEDAVMTLINLANEHPGNVKVSFKFFDGTGRNQIGMQSRGKRISVNRALLDYIEGNNALSYRIN
ncbi:MAG: DNA polymerase III subunit alpha, partial [Bacteroidaceae bacterium]|nr:DNA polymerase III subunit alpha [Bacteroidaceae bacterium]